MSNLYKMVPMWNIVTLRENVEIGKAILEKLDEDPTVNSYELLKYVMTRTCGSVDPRVAMKIIDDQYEKLNDPKRV